MLVAELAARVDRALPACTPLALSDNACGTDGNLLALVSGRSAGKRNALWKPILGNLAILGNPHRHHLSRLETIQRSYDVVDQALATGTLRRP